MNYKPHIVSNPPNPIAMEHKRKRAAMAEASALTDVDVDVNNARAHLKMVPWIVAGAWIFGFISGVAALGGLLLLLGTLN